MGDVHGDTHVREMEPVAQPDERQGDDVMQHQLLEVLPRLLQLQHQDQALLRPVRGLQEIVCLEHRLVRSVRESFVHARGVEIPHRRAAHHVQAKRPEDGEVDRGVELLHEPRQLPSTSYPPI